MNIKQTRACSVGDLCDLEKSWAKTSNNITKKITMKYKSNYEILI